jgi:hypothetical protein
MITKTALSSAIAHTDEADKLLAEITKKIAAARKDAKANPKNWGHAGSLAHVVGQLREISAFLG